MYLSIIVIITSGLIVYNNAFANNETTAYGGLVRSHQTTASKSMIQLLTGKPTYVPGEKIQIIGAFSPNDLIHIDLVNPADGTKNSTFLQSDNTGHFRTNYIVPYNAVNGTWEILATSGFNHASMDIQVISSNYGNMTDVSGSSGSTTATSVESPLKQFRMGTIAQGVRCNTGLQLFFKAEDYTPVCAQSGTATVLLKRGWATTHPPEPFVEKIAITKLQQNYTIGKPINAMVNYAGYYWYTEPDVKIMDANGTQVWFNCPYCNTRHTTMPHLSLDAFTYTVRDYASNKPPVINKTGTYTMIASLDSKITSTEFTIVKPLMSRDGDIAISYNNALYTDGTFYVKQGQNFTLMLNVTSNPVNVPVTLYTAPHSGYTKTNGIDFKLSDTLVNTPAKVMWYMSVSKDATPTTYGATIRLNDTAGMGSVTYLFRVTVK